MIENRGRAVYDLADKIFPYCRSITGQGVRDTLADLKEYIAADNGPELKIYEVPCGTKVFDWTIPKEWVIRSAYIEDEEGSRIIDMAENNLHVLGYSAPVDRWVEREELFQYIYTLPDAPDAIPYVTSYYKERFGFCMSENQKQSLKPGKYHMVVDSEFIDGVLNYAEVILKGESEKEIFFSTYFCHPSMANNECSGPVLLAELIRQIAAMPNRKYTYRCVFVPETIGSITYLSTEDHLADMQKNMVAGFNLSCVGDNRDYSIVETRYADTLADKVLKNVLHYRGSYSTYSYLKRGSDERQYNAPGVELPVVCYCRSKFVEYPEYHTSKDDMTVISPEGFQGSLEVMSEVIEALEHNEYYMVNVLCDPQLGKRGLYPDTSKRGSWNAVATQTNLIGYADGYNDLIDISNIIGVPVKELIPVVDRLIENELFDILPQKRIRKK